MSFKKIRSSTTFFMVRQRGVIRRRCSTLIGISRDIRTCGPGGWSNSFTICNSARPQRKRATPRSGFQTATICGIFSHVEAHRGFRNFSTATSISQCPELAALHRSVIPLSAIWRGAGRDPNPFFDSDWYLSHPDVRACGNSARPLHCSWSAGARDPCTPTGISSEIQTYEPAGRTRSSTICVSARREEEEPRA